MYQERHELLVFRNEDTESSDEDSEGSGSVKRKKLQEGGSMKKKKSETTEEQALKVFYFFIFFQIKPVHLSCSPSETCFLKFAWNVLQEQSELVWHFKDQVTSTLSIQDQKRLLHFNGQTLPSGNSKVGLSAVGSLCGVNQYLCFLCFHFLSFFQVLDLLVDCMVFGTLEPCDQCKGQLIYRCQEMMHLDCCVFFEPTLVQREFVLFQQPYCWLQMHR